MSKVMHGQITVPIELMVKNNAAFGAIFTGNKEGVPIWENDDEVNGKLISALPLYWKNCRETFASIFLPTTRYIFLFFRTSYPAGVEPLYGHCLDVNVQLDRVKSFVAITEHKLGLTETTEFIPTNCPNSFALLVPTWWREHFVRRQFYTAMIRAAIFFTGDYTDTLFNKVSYFQKTNPAVDLFMQGYTTLSPELAMDGFCGWEWAFTKPENLKYLIKP